MTLLRMPYSLGIPFLQGKKDLLSSKGITWNENTDSRDKYWYELNYLTAK